MVSTLISSITGILDTKTAEYVDINVSGITFRLIAPMNTIEEIGSIGESVQLLTSLQFRQDNITLYGFSTEADRTAFETLINNISGVGPRLAISILSTFDAGTLAAAVQAEDINAFTTVSGVGKRTASRIVLELKGKMDNVWSLPTESATDDVFDSLTALGYSVPETREAIASLASEPELTTEDKLRHALQFLTSR
jgi:Holliday junction DNA helicase RuvA|tara:strand:- start:193 stop:780 length:588 start_codon:yes stop_codon:yes gene_type:complete